MSLEIWVGLVEVRQLPGLDHEVVLSGKGAYTWVTCWAENEETYRTKVSEVMAHYGLFIVETEQVMSFVQAEECGIVGDKLAEQFEDTNRDQNYCIYGTFHNYPSDN